MDNLNTKKDGVNSNSRWVVLKASDKIIKTEHQHEWERRGYTLHKNYWDARAELIKRIAEKKK